MRVLLCFLLASTAAAHDIDGLRDQFGQPYHLASWGEDRFVVVTFLGVDCPLAGLYTPRLVELRDKYAGQGVGFVVVNSNQQDSYAEMCEFGKSLPFPVLKDVGHKVADDFQATRSPEVFLLNASRDVIYHGRIDDQYAPGFHGRSEPLRADLEEAIKEALTAKPISVPATEATGCRIDRSQPQTNGPTYTNKVAAIFDAKCVECHRPGQVAPFSLVSYEDTVGWAGTIAEVVKDRRMPPWGADGGHFANDRSLNDSDRDTILAWVEAGA